MSNQIILSRDTFPVLVSYLFEGTPVFLSIGALISIFLLPFILLYILIFLFYVIRKLHSALRKEGFKCAWNNTKPLKHRVFNHLTIVLALFCFLVFALRSKLQYSACTSYASAVNSGKLALKMYNNASLIRDKNTCLHSPLTYGSLFKQIPLEEIKKAQERLRLK